MPQFLKFRWKDYLKLVANYGEQGHWEAFLDSIPIIQGVYLQQGRLCLYTSVRNVRQQKWTNWLRFTQIECVLDYSNKVWMK